MVFGARFSSSSSTMSPSSVCTRARGLDCARSDDGSHMAAIINRIRDCLVTTSEPVRQRELELAARQDVAAARVLTKTRVANQVDVAAGEQVLVVEHVEDVSAELDVIGPHRELLAEREI